ncbi:hypothetical protein SDC9_161031 [bioreactor metagenome]|uniref:Uncharacterized protein n=1 Tax=bioreactor metagenome TaxID=1076179 RepID=A0A645FH98_9ZZZZ
MGFPVISDNFYKEDHISQRRDHPDIFPKTEIPLKLNHLFIQPNHQNPEQRNTHDEHTDHHKSIHQ